MPAFRQRLFDSAPRLLCCSRGIFPPPFRIISPRFKACHLLQCVRQSIHSICTLSWQLDFRRSDVKRWLHSTIVHPVSACTHLPLIHRRRRVVCKTHAGTPGRRGAHSEALTPAITLDRSASAYLLSHRARRNRYRYRLCPCAGGGVARIRHQSGQNKTDLQSLYLSQCLLARDTIFKTSSLAQINIAWRKGGTERIGDEGALARSRGMSGPYLSRIRQEEWRGTMRGSRRRAINAIYHGSNSMQGVIYGKGMAGHGEIWRL